MRAYTGGTGCDELRPIVDGLWLDRRRGGRCDQPRGRVRAVSAVPLADAPQWLERCAADRLVVFPRAGAHRPRGRVEPVLFQLRAAAVAATAQGQAGRGARP